MPLSSKLFTQPTRNLRLDNCLKDDAWHIKQVQRGEHVRLIQTALNKLSEGPGRENFNLKVDGVFGPLTGNAVQAYKNAASRRILQPNQKTADKVVGKRTIESLDNEMQIHESILPTYGGLIAFDHLGFPHDHSKCPKPTWDGTMGPDGRITHHATPMNPLGRGRMVCIGGVQEVAYLGFKDYVPDPKQDKEMLPSWVGGRPFTRELPNRSCSDICLRSAPITPFLQQELKRIASHGCRLTYASNVGKFYDIDSGNIARTLLYMRSLGPVVEQAVVAEPTGPKDQSLSQSMHVIVVSMIHLG